MNNLRHIRNVIYRLKRNFGSAIKIITVSEPDVDYETGITTPNETETSIRYALVLPVQVAMESFINVPKFNYGAVEDANTRVVVIDRQDYSTEPSVNDYIEYEGLRWAIKSINATALDRHVVITIQSTINQSA